MAEGKDVQVEHTGIVEAGVRPEPPPPAREGRPTPRREHAGQPSGLLRAARSHDIRVDGATSWLERHIAPLPRSARRDRIVIATPVLIVVGFATLDVLIDVHFSHSAVYVLPVVLAAVLTSSSWVVIVAMLRHAQLRSTAAEQRSRRFLADAAHQLRTPIAGLQASAETLLMMRHTKGQEPILMNIAHQGARSGRLINGLLQLCRLDGGETRSARPVDVTSLCFDQVESVRRLCSPSIEVGLETGSAPDHAVVLDPDGTREALSNLLDNARRHARHRIEVRVEHRGEAVAISVTDDGPGLDPSIADAAFEPFASFDGHGGSGLGLPIARGFVERQGGELTYRAGTFVIQLPC